MDQFECLCLQYPLLTYLLDCIVSFGISNACTRQYHGHISASTVHKFSLFDPISLFSLSSLTSSFRKVIIPIPLKVLYSLFCYYYYIIIWFPFGSAIKISIVLFMCFSNRGLSDLSNPDDPFGYIATSMVKTKEAKQPLILGFFPPEIGTKR